MIIKKIKLYNFGSYYEFNEFEFCHGDKNVTLINAENGTGKTTLLNALKWCLYGLEGGKNTNNQIINKDNQSVKPIDLLNKKINIEFAESEKRFSVELFFKKDGKDYKIVRTNTFKGNKQLSGNNTTNKDSLYLYEEGIKVSDAQGVIDMLIPRSLNFFFEGEANLNKLGSNSSDIKSSIYNVLGLRPIQNAITDLKDVAKNLDNEYEKLTSENNTYQKLIDDRDQLKKEVKNLNELKNDKRDEETSLEKILEKLKDDRDSIPEQTLKKSSENQKKLEELLNNLNKKETNEEQLKKEYNLFLSKESYKIFSNKIFQSAYDIIKEKYNKNEVPTKYEKEFLNGLLESKECLCGTKLLYETDAYKKIKELYEYSVTRKSRNNFTLIYNLLKDEKKDSTELEKKIGNYQIKLIEFNDEKEKLQDEKDQLVLKSKNKDLIVKYDTLKKDIAIKERKLTDIKRSIRNFDFKIEKAIADINSLIKQIVEAEKKEVKNIILKERKNLANNLLKKLNLYFDKNQKKARLDLESSIKFVYGKVNGKNWKVELDEKFSYSLRDFDGSIPKQISGAETKNKALGFVGGLIMCAKKLNRDNFEDAGIKGGIYPLVLDAPYGELDEGYRVQITKIMPSLSEQVIIMVNSGQWSFEMEESILAKIGKKYSLDNIKKNNENEKYDITFIREEV